MTVHDKPSVRMRKWLIYLAVASALLFVIWVAYVAGAAFYWQSYIGDPLERDLGFGHGTPYVTCNGWLQEVLVVESLTPGGVFEQAGFRQGDIIRGLSINDLFRLLHRGRGQQVMIRVVDGGDGPPLAERPERTITFVVPP